MQQITALTATVPGDILLLEAGATWSGNFTLRAKSGDATITIASSAWDRLPTFGTRVSPSNAALMPHINSPSNLGAINMALGAHHWRMYGIASTPTGTAPNTGLWSSGSTGAAIRRS